MPTHHNLFDYFNDEIEDDAEQRQHQYAGENEPCVEFAVGDQHQIAEAFFSADEFSDDCADNRKRARNLKATENRR